MNFWTDLRIRTRQFFKKYKNIIIIALVAWAVIFVINMILKYRKEPETPISTYTPNKSIMSDEEVPKKVHTTANKILDEFVEYCNQKQYEKAYNMIDEECREEVYGGIDLFIKHIQEVFGNSKKIYNIQNYSNVGKTYVYNIRILEDIITTGTTGNYNYYEEKIVFKDTNNGIKLCMGGFIGKEEINVIAEDDYMKINIYEKVLRYETEEYRMKITNKTQDTIVLYDGSVSSEIVLDIGNQTRGLENYENGAIIINPGATKEIGMEFTKFFDDGRTANKLIFNSIRVLKSYSGEENRREQELANATKLYSMNIDLK